MLSDGFDIAAIGAMFAAPGFGILGLLHIHWWPGALAALAAGVGVVPFVAWKYGGDGDDE
jgi:hypothetical protein